MVHGRPSMMLGADPCPTPLLDTISLRDDHLRRYDLGSGPLRHLLAACADGRLARARQAAGGGGDGGRGGVGRAAFVIFQQPRRGRAATPARLMVVPLLAGLLTVRPNKFRLQRPKWLKLQMPLWMTT